MTIKNWNLESCLFKKLVDGSSDNFTLSGSGTSEYYYNSGDLIVKPNKVLEDGTAMNEGTLGSLSSNEWAWGDNDSLGNNTLYVRTTDDSDPDSKLADYIQCTEPKQLLQVEVGAKAFLLSLLISNQTLSSVNIHVFHMDSVDNVLFKYIIDIPGTNSPFALDSKLTFIDQQQIKIMASIEEVSAWASGDEE